MTENENIAEKTIDLAELTSRLGRPAHEQQGVAAFFDEPGPWTEDETLTLIHVWEHTDPETGIYHPSQQYR